MPPPSHAPIDIISGGAVRASCLHHSAKAAWTHALLLEKNKLASGSTWHAAGNVPTFSMPWSLMNMQRYSVDFYQGVAILRAKIATNTELEIEICGQQYKAAVQPDSSLYDPENKRLRT